MSNYTVEDVLLNSVAVAFADLEWVTSLLARVNGGEGVEFPVLVDAMTKLGAAMRLKDHYSDGRPVRTGAVIDEHFTYYHVWPHRARQVGERFVHEGARIGEPGRDNGRYRIYVTEDTCTVRIELIDQNGAGVNENP